MSVEITLKLLTSFQIGAVFCRVLAPMTFKAPLHIKVSRNHEVACNLNLLFTAVSVALFKDFLGLFRFLVIYLCFSSCVFARLHESRLEHAAVC